ncbi:MAG TPA: ThuA domain-containing protein [Terriglobia bacterium]|nr:ThuA domain-containing protein [Terriglobia bacterium]
MELYKRALLFLSIALVAAGPSVAQNTTADRIPLFKKGAIRVLILTGQNNHDWRSTTPVLRDMLLNTGRFDVRVNEEPTGMTAETLAIYNVVVLNYNGPRLGQTAESALEDFVRSGGGLVGVHGANWAFSGLVVLGAGSVPTEIMEPPWPAYKQMIGGVWSDQPPASGHAPRHKFNVKVVDQDSPITEGLPKTFEANDELYHNMHMAPGVHILATAFDDLANKSHTPPPASAGKETQTATGPDRSAKWPHLDNNPTGKDEPMLWTIRYGRGRTFYTTLGHDVKAMDLPGFSTTFVRGVEWAATGKVKQPPPKFRSWAEPLPSNSQP